MSMSDPFSAEVPEADALEQRRDAGLESESSADDTMRTSSSEANSADALEQSITVELDQDDAPAVEPFRD
ncbi:hypothetical protein [Leucobacter chromiiresistens]|uniref:Uncharacterized protein n=1 Tax=Leucobacter chromiiresistens TaxID=1079994 RepID=A0A1H0Y4Q2_9MICO|nr:hypothetical protein [Leucobacter chromiiresistens]SDQ09946.1 hypothetical protein SAMN04488565_0504 [Leucobacter chromiiresistens]